MGQWCSDEFSIRRDSVANWGFRYKDQVITRYEADDIICDVCKARLDGRYTTIIFNLQNAGLLPQDYKMRCCSCFFISNYKDDRHCEVCGDLLEADFQDWEIHIFCVGGCIEDFYPPTKADMKYLKEYIEGEPVSIREQIEGYSRIEDVRLKYIKWLLE